MKTIILAAAFFMAGVFGSDFVISAYRLFFSGDQTITCLPDDGPCVGDKLSESNIGGLYLFDKIGGLTWIICEDLDPTQIDEESLFVKDILKGERCAGEIEGLEFRNTTTRTMVILEDGVITKISRGPLHAIDF